MADELFKHEQAIIDAAKALLAGEGLHGKTAHLEYRALLKNCEKLVRDMRRLVRIGDRTEAELNRVAKRLDEKNGMLEALSAKLSKYLSPQIYASIFSGERDVVISAERKKLTVFFSDIKDFTETTDDMEPEELTGLLNAYLTEMSAIALEYGATIDKYIGDAMVMFFGDPESRGVKADARACVHMAIAMQRRMRELQEAWWDRGIERPFHMRIGINTGYCTVGNFGSNALMDYTIIGGEVNLAARLESIASPDGTTMSYETYALVKDEIVAKASKPIHVKGIRREVRPYQVLGIFDDAEKDKQRITSEQEGLRLLVDLGSLDKQGRQAAVKELEKAIERLKQG